MGWYFHGAPGLSHADYILLFTLRRLLFKISQNALRQLMKPPTEDQSDQSGALLRFATSDSDEFVEMMSGVAPGLSCSAVRPRGMNTEICAAVLPDMGIFTSTLQNFRVQSPVRPFYGVTIPLAGRCEFLVEGAFEDYHEARGHLQDPDKPFDGKMSEAPLESLQMCFDRAALDSCATRLLGSEDRKISLMETLDMARPAVRSFARHAMFIWSEILRGGPVLTTPMIARESVHLLEALLVSAAHASAEDCENDRSGCCPAGVRRAEEYLMANLGNPISIADVAVVARMSARSLSRGFRRHRGTTIKGFIKERRLEAANRILLAAEPGETNVTRVALDLGFEQLGRFSGDYRKTFGELPSETLVR
jgi:AraC-like DNA-binding protein